MKSLFLLLILSFLPIFGADKDFDIKIITENENMAFSEQQKLTVTIKNNQDIDATDVRVLLYLPKELKFIASSDGEYYPKNKEEVATVCWLLDKVEAKETVKLVVTVESVFMGFGQLNIFSELICGDVRITEQIKLENNRPKLFVKLDANSKVIFTNKQVMLTVTIENRENFPIHNAKVQLSLLEELEYVSSDSGKYYQSSKELAKICWDFAVIEPNEKLERKVFARGIMGAQRTICVAQLAFEEYTFTDELGIRIQGVLDGSSVSTYDTEDPLEVGQLTTYVVTARNEGTSAVTNIILVNKIPEQMEFVIAKSPTEYEYNAETNTVHFFPFEILQLGDSLTYQIVCRGIKSGSAKNVAKLKYDQFTKVIIDEEGTSVYE